jgi:hypothetical protein
MRSLFIILAVGTTSYHFRDVRSAHWGPRLFFPAVFSLCLVALVYWLYMKSRKRREGRGDFGESGGFSFSGGGGDGDGGD